MSRNAFLQLAVGFAISFATLTGCSESGAPPTDQTSATQSLAVDSSEAPAGRLGNSVVPNRYDIELKIDPSQESFSGEVTIDISFNEPSDTIWLHGKNLDISEVYLTDSHSNRVEASYEEHLESGVSLLSLERMVGTGPATLHFTYSAPFNTSVNALFKVVRGEDSYAATQLEAIAARQVFPGFDDPGFKVPFDLTVVTRADDVVVTNTPEASAETLADGFVRHVFETTRPLPTYLLAFAVGPYDLVDYGMIPANSIRDREVALRGITARGLGSRMEYALRNTDGLLSLLEEYFGTPYPYKKLDLIAVPESFGGAMENVGAQLRTTSI
jgi:alanyl aminopeptidase